MHMNILSAILNVFSPLKIHGDTGCIKGCSLWRLRFSCKGVIDISSGNTLQFVDETLNRWKFENPTAINIKVAGKGNVVRLSAKTDFLPPDLQVGGDGNVVSVGHSFRPLASKLAIYWFGSHNRLSIGDNITFHRNPRIAENFDRISMGGTNCSVEIKDDSTCGLNIISGVHAACRDWHFECGPHACISGLVVQPNSSCLVHIGRDVQISWNVLIGCGSHAIVDAQGDCRNLCAGVEIGDHVWIGVGVVIPGTARVPNGSIVGSNSVVTKCFDTPKAVYAGVPAKMIKEGVDWRWEYPVMYQNGMAYKLA